MKRIVSIFLITMLIYSFSFPMNAESRTRFTERQQARVNIIYQVISENWERYGVLPSVCIAQAFVESTLGEHCPSGSNNYWGIASGAESYGSIEAGVYRYMRVINNGYYKDAPFCKNPYTQLRRILAGGYCQPVGDYYSNGVWAIEHYNLRKYDRMMFAKIEKRKKQKLEKQRKIKLAKEKAKRIKNAKKTKFLIKYNPEIGDSVAKCNCLLLKQGSTICVNGLLYVVGKGQKDNVIELPDKELDGKLVYIEYFENSNG